MGGIVVDAAARMPVHAIEEQLERRAVEQILARMQLESDVDALGVAEVEDRLPPFGELVEGAFDEPSGPLRERGQERPGQGAGEAHHRVEAEVAAGRRRGFDLLDGPAGAGLGLATHGRGGEAVDERIVRRGDGDEVALEMGRELGDDQAMLPESALDLVTVGPARGRLLEVEQTRVPGGNLN